MSSADIRPTAVSLLLTLAAGFGAWFFLAALGPDWSIYPPSTCQMKHCFCEAPRIGSLALQPANAWSSMGYVFVGWLMILWRGDPASALSQTSARLLGVTAIFIGLGSVMLHATLTFWGQILDNLGMYLTGAFLLVRAVARWRGLSERSSVIGYVMIVVALVALLVTLPELRRWLFAFILIAAIVIEWAFARPLRPGAKFGWFRTGLALDATAFGIWILDQQRIICSPHSLLQGHAIWHFLGAAALWCVFQYYLSERHPNRVVS